jgi:L-asparaginase
MKHILLISTGGTISSKEENGSLKPALSGADMTALIPELSELCELSCMALFDKDSTNIQPEDWVMLGEAIDHNMDDYDGFVVTHGTDTMAYTASALFYMLQNVKKPVILTGSQLPLLHPETDGKRNILDGVRTALCSEYPGVYIVFNGEIIKGNCGSKLDTKGFHAFSSITEKRAGIVSGEGAVQFENPIPMADEPYQFMPGLDTRVLLLKLYPGFEPEVLKTLAGGCHGVILETFGAGGVPYMNRNLLPVIRELTADGIPVFCKSQCLYGGSDLTIYEVGAKALAAGVKDMGNMTTEAALTQLMWQLGNEVDLS